MELRKLAEDNVLLLWPSILPDTNCPEQYEWQCEIPKDEAS